MSEKKRLLTPKQEECLTWMNSKKLKYTVYIKNSKIYVIQHAAADLYREIRPDGLMVPLETLPKEIIEYERIND